MHDCVGSFTVGSPLTYIGGSLDKATVQGNTIQWVWEGDIPAGQTAIMYLYQSPYVHIVAGDVGKQIQVDISVLGGGIITKQVTVVGVS
jgi:hypothetical protein